MKKFEILRYLKRFSLLIFLVALAGAAAIYLYADGRQKYTASVIIRYTNDGIANGYTPDGSELDVNEIYSSTVISQAMDALGASGRLSTIRSNISVTPVISEDQQTINEALLSKGEEVTYFPDTYKVSLVVDGEQGMGYARNMLDAIIQSYCTYYTEKYVEQKLSLNPSSALLEVLDPEQNHTFSDHYLNVPFDLSKVMFLCTANHLETIPAPLRDRMEVISLPGYTMQEKVEIAKRHLLPKKVTENGLREGDVIMDDTALTAVIRGYTREAGLRNLERELGSICRKLARQRAEGKKGSFTVDSAMVEKLLGAPRFIEDEKDKRLMPGMALGLAWTPAGGEVLTIECACMEGKGNLQLTGQLGDVMKESARIAMSYIRSRADSLGIDADFSDTQDIHIHVPAGAVPKDGPSAGVTLTSALISALSGRIVRADTCMTGEITLQGRVLPVGGIKEKILAGVARGLKHVIIPSQNVKDLEEVPKELLKKIKVHPAHTYDDVLALAFEPVKKTAARAKKAAPATEKK